MARWRRPYVRLADISALAYCQRAPTPYFEPLTPVEQLLTHIRIQLGTAERFYPYQVVLSLTDHEALETALAPLIARLPEDGLAAFWRSWYDVRPRVNIHQPEGLAVIFDLEVARARVPLPQLALPFPVNQGVSRVRNVPHLPHPEP